MYRCTPTHHNNIRETISPWTVTLRWHPKGIVEGKCGNAQGVYHYYGKASGLVKFLGGVVRENATEELSW